MVVGGCVGGATVGAGVSVGGGAGVRVGPGVRVGRGVQVGRRVWVGGGASVDVAVDVLVEIGVGVVVAVATARDVVVTGGGCACLGRARPQQIQVLRETRAVTPMVRTRRSFHCVRSQVMIFIYSFVPHAAANTLPLGSQ